MTEPDPHGHDHAPPVDEPAPEPIDPARRRLWRVSVMVGAILFVVGWVAMPAGHVTDVYRPLRHVQGSPYTLGLAATVFAAAWLLTAVPEPRPSRPHLVGAWAIRVTAGLATALALATWIAPDQPVVFAIVAWLVWPVVVTVLVLGFGYVGRVHRLLGQPRMANLADLCGLALPVLWIGSQLVTGYPGPATWGPGLAGMVVAGLVVAAVPVGVVRRPVDTPNG